MSTLDAVNDRTFDEHVLMSEKPVLVEFWAEWCGPCRQLGPVLEQIADERPSINVVKINADENPEISTNYKVMGLPTSLLFVGGRPVTQIVGAKSKSAFLKLVDEGLVSAGRA
jgi:thioredoxin 1